MLRAAMRPSRYLRALRRMRAVRAVHAVMTQGATRVAVRDVHGAVLKIALEASLIRR